MDKWLFDPLGLGAWRGAPGVEKAAEEPQKLTLGRQIVFYVTVVLGNFASSFLQSYQAGALWRPNWPGILFALIVGFVLLPGAVDQNKLNGHKEELVQYSMVLTYGMGWQTLIGAAIKAATGS